MKFLIVKILRFHKCDVGKQTKLLSDVFVSVKWAEEGGEAYWLSGIR